jgi:hypothetical protein
MKRANCSPMRILYTSLSKYMNLRVHSFSIQLFIVNRFVDTTTWSQSALTSYYKLINKSNVGVIYVKMYVSVGRFLKSLFPFAT